MIYVKKVSTTFRHGSFTIRAKIWHSRADHDAGQQPFINDDFIFSIDTYEGQDVVLDPADGWPLMDNDERAPSYTLSEARQMAIDDNPTLPVLQSIVNGLPANFPTKAEVDTRWSNMVETLKDKYLGVPYLPQGRTWKMQAVKRLTPAKILSVIRKRYDREVARLNAAQQFASDPDIVAFEDGEI